MLVFSLLNCDLMLWMLWFARYFKGLDSNSWFLHLHFCFKSHGRPDEDNKIKGRLAWYWANTTCLLGTATLGPCCQVVLQGTSLSLLSRSETGGRVDLTQHRDVRPVTPGCTTHWYRNLSNDVSNKDESCTANISDIVTNPTPLYSPCVLPSRGLSSTSLRLQHLKLVIFSRAPDTGSVHRQKL